MHLGAHSKGGLPVTGVCSSPTISHNSAWNPHEVNGSAADMLQVLIYQALGFQEPTFGHVSLILAPDKSKLSKRHGATSVGEFRAQGYLPEAMINYLSLLGWNDGTEQVSTTGLSRRICSCIARGNHKYAVYRKQAYLPEASMDEVSLWAGPGMYFST